MYYLSSIYSSKRWQTKIPVMAYILHFPDLLKHSDHELFLQDRGFIYFFYFFTGQVKLQEWMKCVCVSVCVYLIHMRYLSHRSVTPGIVNSEWKNIHHNFHLEEITITLLRKLLLSQENYCIYLSRDIPKDCVCMTPQSYVKNNNNNNNNK